MFVKRFELIKVILRERAPNGRKWKHENEIGKLVTELLEMKKKVNKGLRKLVERATLDVTELLFAYLKKNVLSYVNLCYRHETISMSIRLIMYTTK